MSVRPDDVWVVTYPKCGTTWTQEMVWQIAHGVDLEGGKKWLNDRFPFLEFETLLDFRHQMPGLWGRLVESLFSWVRWWNNLSVSKPRSWAGYKNVLEELEAVDQLQPRFIKSHLPLSLLPPRLLDTAKVVYVARNPRDAMVSFYHHHKHLTPHGYVGDLPTFARRFMQDQIMDGPFFKHLEEAWELKENPNLLFIFFEDMKQDLKSVIRKVSKFLNSPLTDVQVEQLAEHLDFKNFKNNPAVNLEDGKIFGFASKEGSFIRKGQVGGWKEEFKDYPDMEREFNEWLDKQMMYSEIQFPK